MYCVLFVVIYCFLLILLLISCGHFVLYLWSWVDKRLCACFAFFFCLPVCFLAFALHLHINLVQRTPHFPSLDLNYPLSHIIVVVNMTNFFTLVMHPKHVFLDYLRLFLHCFCSPPYPCINPNPSELICTHLYPSVSLFTHSPKTWRSGNFP